MYEHGAGLRIQVKRARVPRPGEPDALTGKQQGAVEQAATRRGARDAAIIAVLLYWRPGRGMRPRRRRRRRCDRPHQHHLGMNAATGPALLGIHAATMGQS